MEGIYLGLGTNLGDREEHLENALILIEKKIGPILKKSTIHETKAWGNINQPDFLNMVIRIDTGLSPKELLKYCLEIENKLGRVRTEKWGERIIDIDILYYNDLIINEKYLTIPHPYIFDRDFVLNPLKEIAKISKF